MSKKHNIRNKILLVLAAIVLMSFLLYARAFPRNHITIEDIQIYLPPFWRVIYDRHVVVLSKFPYKHPLIIITANCNPKFQLKNEAEKTI